jgi:signal transduction histidine kinase
VTARASAEDELRRSAAGLERSNAELADFAAVVAHDLAEPLHVIDGYSHLLRARDSVAGDEDASAYVERVSAATSRLQRLIVDVLEYALAGAGPLASEPVEIAGLVARTAALVEATLERAGATVRVDGELPTVVGDGGQLERVMLNLFTNAARFTRDGVAPVITVSARRGVGSWEITVADNGIGVAPENREAVFAMFTRLRGGDGRGGTGMGLAACRRIIEAHGGEIWLEASPDGGTAAVFTLPDR